MRCVATISLRNAVPLARVTPWTTGISGQHLQ